MRVVVGTRYTLQLTCRYEFSGKNACSTLNALTAIIGKLHFVIVELDAITKDAEYGTCSHDIGVKAFLLEVSIERNEKQQ